MAHPSDFIEKGAQTWKTRDKQVWVISDMTDSHLTNTLKYLHRNVETYRHRLFLDAMAYPEPRGDMASDAYDAGMRQMESAGPRETLTNALTSYKWLEAEAVKRKLPVVEELALNEDEYI